MNGRQIRIQANWLTIVLAAHRNRFQKLLLRLRGMGPRANASPSLHRKFMRFLAQVAYEQEKEIDLLHKIETVERHHKYLRDQRRLRRAGDTPPPLTVPMLLCPAERPGRDRYGYSLLKLIGLLMLLSGPAVKHKEQKLAID